jgi:hypothetical protein
MKNRLVEFLAYLGIGQTKFEEKVGLSRGFVNTLKNNLTIKTLSKIESAYPELNTEWLKTGIGAMLKTEISNKLIPFYDDIATIGGANSNAANMQGTSSPTEYIDAGDWFREATAAIRHYGDSMTEYPPGCILALKEVQERQLIIWGKDYVIETSEYRITKRVQRGDSDAYIKAYSSNAETYPDGKLIHEPQDIAWKHIRRIFIVLGYVVKKNGGTIVFNDQK